ncbi:exodeoxyribonuclease III [bacterium]|nr:exodeoxyribonuclease III [bacterium]
MRLVSWNVNGIRAILKKGFPDFVQSCDADIICLQEIKARPEQVEMALDGYHAWWNPAIRPGYSGVATLSRIAPLSVRLGMDSDEHDREGRVLTLEFDGFFLVNVYTPNAGRDLRRLEYRTQKWDTLFLNFLRDLERDKPVVFCGDLNVAHREIDLAHPANNRRNAGFTDEERAGFDHIVQAGFIDTFREFHQEGGHYTWWSYVTRARERNVGWRIDYFCISPALRPRLRNAAILPETMGSDHCPVMIELT